MNTLFFILVLVLLTLGFARLVVKGTELHWVSVRLLGGWMFLLPLLLLVNSQFPFTEGGDDMDYYYLASTSINSWEDVFDLTRFAGSMEQPGYPWLLSLVFQFTGDSLIALKALNLALFLMLVPIWQRIGLELESKDFARRLGVVILCLTPLWFYGFFLLKDMAITFLQSLFLLGVVQVVQHRGLKPWLLIIAATVVTILFRSPLVLVNLAVVIGVVALPLIRRGKVYQKIVGLTFAVIVVGGLLMIASNQEWMAAMGIQAEHRVIGSAEMRETVAQAGESSLINRWLFPLLYLFSETAGLNPQTWSNFDSFSLRGILAIPWIFFGVPFFVFGMLWLLRRDVQVAAGRGLFSRIGHLRVVTSAWSGIVLFILIYLALSWQVGDTTRWRLPDMPAMAAVALAGWMYGVPRSRHLILLLWIGGAGTLFSLFYWVRA